MRPMMRAVFQWLLALGLLCSGTLCDAADPNAALPRVKEVCQACHGMDGNSQIPQADPLFGALNYILVNGPDGWLITDVESPHDSLRMFIDQFKN